MGIRTAALLAAAPAAVSTNQSEARAPAEFYLNIGFETDDPEYPFVDLPKSGIALDRVQLNEVRGDLNTPWKKFAAQQDALITAFMGRAEKLAPGETAVVALDEQTGLAMQIRRVSNKADMPIETAEIKGLNFR